MTFPFLFQEEELLCIAPGAGSSLVPVWSRSARLAVACSARRPPLPAGADAVLLRGLPAGAPLL